MNRIHLVAGVCCGLSCVVAVAAPTGRKTVSLDGTWQVAEGSLNSRPTEFLHSGPVPGLVDMASPPFEQPGSTVSATDRGSPWLRPADPRREAFWYRRTFTIAGAVPAVAMLKLNKAAYTSKVFLNGQAVGEHLSSFTPCWFDLRPHLRGEGQENELVIRVGASLAQVPAHLTDGWDNEKSRYVPGIYDSVQLVLTGTPHVVNIQAVPDLQTPAVRTVIELGNAGGVAGPVRLTGVVREVKSGRVAGQATVEAASPVVGATVTAELKVTIPDAHLWTPEDPFLYEVAVDTGADKCTARFGMRTFSTDPKSSRFLLNGKPYFLRGSNVCIYRFFEDAQRGSLPWDATWVRTLHQRFKDMHWNSLRYCIGFPPEQWYAIADEEGILIQDEFPIWYSRAKGGWPEAITVDSLVGEFTAWMRDRWNHPCVVIWDAQNETKNGVVTGDALQRVRSLDLSNRPWDNGWGDPQTPGDIWECHPYRSSGGNFSLARFARTNPLPNSPGLRKFDNVPLINEYGWLWINRDGSLPTLTVEVYKRAVGENATPTERWHYYARTLAAKTEFWRSHRKCGGVLHFCGLGYSRPDGQTSDNFIDIQNLIYQPDFHRYVGDAFAPVGIMLDFWADSIAPDAKVPLPVRVINDRDTPWTGTVRLRMLKDNVALVEQTRPLTVAAGGDGEVSFELTMPAELGDYRFEAALAREGDTPVCSLRDVTVRKPVPNLALGRPVTASSEVRNSQGFFPAALAVDDDPGTRWSSAFKDGQWLAIDLGQKKTVSRVEISWEKAGASQYLIEVSDDGASWREVAREMKGTCTDETLKFAPIETRWIRMRALRRATAFGVSIWEFRVF